MSRMLRGVNPITFHRHMNATTLLSTIPRTTSYLPGMKSLLLYQVLFLFSMAFLSGLPTQAMRTIRRQLSSAGTISRV